MRTPGIYPIASSEANGRQTLRVIAAVPPGAPLFSTARTATVAVFWPSPSTSWTLQVNTNSVNSVNWSNVTAGIADNGAVKTLIVNPPTGNRFYRLWQP